MGKEGITSAKGAPEVKHEEGNKVETARRTIEGKYEKAVQDVYEIQLLMHMYLDTYPQMLGQFEQLSPLAKEWNEILASSADPWDSKLPGEIATAISELKKQAPDILKQHPFPGEGRFLERSVRRAALKKIANRYPSPEVYEGPEWDAHPHRERSKFFEAEYELLEKEEEAESAEESRRRQEVLAENDPLIKEYNGLAKDLDVAFRSGQLEDETQILRDKVKRFNELAEDLAQKRIFWSYEYRDKTPWEKQLEEEEKVLETARKVQERRQAREARREGVRYWQEVFPQ